MVSTKPALSDFSPLGETTGLQTANSTSGDNAASVTSEAYRAACFGEALLAISRYVDADSVSPPNQETLECLGIAFGKIAKEHSPFTPEDFALYAMSVLHRNADEQEKDAHRTRLGAMRYLLDVRPRLSPKFQSLSDEARAFLEVQQEPAIDRLPKLPTAGQFDRTPCPNAFNSSRSNPTSGLGPQRSSGGSEQIYSDPPYRRTRLHLSEAGASNNFDSSLRGEVRLRKSQHNSKKRHALLGFIFVAVLAVTFFATYLALALLFP